MFAALTRRESLLKRVRGRTLDLDDAVCVKARALEERGLTANTLCARCKYGMIMRRRNRLELMVFCRRFWDTPTRVPEDLAECSCFEAHTKMTIAEMGELALPVDPRKGVNEKSYL